MTLDELYTALVNANINNQLNLVPGVLSSGQIAAYYQQLLQQQDFVITGSTIEKSADGKTVTIKNGTTSLLGMVSLPVTMSFTQPDDFFICSLSGKLLDGTWDIAGISWFAIDSPFLNINVNDSNDPVTGAIGGEVNIGTPLTLQMNLPVQLDQWTLSASFTSNYPSISFFSQLLGIGNVSNALPAPLNAFTDIGVSDLSLAYDAKAKSVNSIGVVLQTNQSWPLLSNLTLETLQIALAITNPGDAQTRSTDVVIAGYFHIGKKDPGTGKYPNTIKATAVYAPFAMTVSLQDGDIQLGDLLELFVPSVSINLHSAITGFFMEIDPTAKNYILDCAIATDWDFFNLQNPSLTFTMKGLGLSINSQMGNTDAQIAGLFHIGPSDPDKGLDLTLTAGYSNKAWQFTASTGQDQKISLGDIAETFLKAFGLSNIPAWVSKDLPSIENIFFSALLPDQGAAGYQLKGDVKWPLQFGSFNMTLTAQVDITYKNSAASGLITGTADAHDMLGLTFIMGYQFGQPDTEIYLKIPELSSTIDYKSNADFDVIDITFTDISLGELLSTLLRTVIPGFSLSSPWDVLNSIDLSGSEFKYTRYKDSAKSSIVATIPINLDLGFINITNLKITKDGTAANGGSGVYIYLEGTFLGLPIDSNSPLQKDGKGSDATNMPDVPGMGDQFFDLRLLAMGQHVSIYDPKDLSTVSASIDALQTAFTTTSDPGSTAIPVPASSTKPGTLIFDQNSNWLIGTDFTVAKFYRIAAVFNDPNMYGLLVGVSDKADFFKNLQFEILYKKINDTIGMYQMDLQLPDQFRHLEFGEVSITLPIIGVKVYTNGNFYLDFGFPASITDFSRSFSVQVFPFVGFGGFYFGYLNGATSTNVPATTCGTFNPVIELGLGLSIGVGKTVDEGILKAGLSITAVGIFQGVLGFFHANPSLQTTDGTYYKIQGTFGITGHLYGEINFAIISARLDVLAFAYVTITIESYKPIPIGLTVGVSVSLSVKINLGLFSIHISLHFSATISASFTIGSDTSATAPWNLCLPKQKSVGALANSSFAYAITDAPVVLKWQPIIPNAPTALDLVFIPQLTVSGEAATPGSQYVGMLYINAGATDKSLDKFTEGVFYWTINALVGNNPQNTGLDWLKDQSLTATQVSQLLCYFNTRVDNVSPFNYQNGTHHDIKTFLSNYFLLNIRAADPKSQEALEAAVFSIVPELVLNTLYKGQAGTPVNFATQSMTGTQNYISDISGLLASMSVDYQSKITQDYYAPSLCSNVTDPDYENQPDLSFATFLFTDFIALVAKQALQSALDYLKTQNGQTAKIGATAAAVIPVSAQSIGGMASRFMLHGLRLPAPPVAQSGQVRPLYVITGQQIPVPAGIQTTDSYAITLQNTSGTWINMVNGVNDTLTVTIDNDEIQRTIDMGTITLAPSLNTGPAPITRYHDIPQSFSLGAPALWQYPGDYFPGLSNKPTLWKLPSSLSSVFAAGGNPAFDIFTLTNSGSSPEKNKVNNLSWSTAITISLQKITAPGGMQTALSANMYNLVGADEAGIVFLENLISYLNTNNDPDGIQTIQQIQVLYQPDPVKNANGGYVSAENGKFKTAIIQSNLSTETNPVTNLAALALTERQVPPSRDYNSLNQAGDFIKLLWECSIVRSGGFYFYYNTADNKGLPDTLFSGNGLASLTLVVTYDALIAAPFTNSVVIGDLIDIAKTAVYAQSAEVMTRVATVLPGCVGYEMSRNYPGIYTPTKTPTKADDQIYLQYQFNLVGASLPAEPAYQNLLPAGPADPASEEAIYAAKGKLAAPSDDSTLWNYKSIIPYYKYVQPKGIDPAYPDPYAGIGTTVQIALNWQDMFGNIPSAGTAPLRTSMDLLYTDTIVAMSQWPSISLGYLFENGGSVPVLDLYFIFNPARYTGDGAKANAQIDLLNYMKLFYQLSDGNLSINYSTSLEDTINPQGKTVALLHTLDITALLTHLINPVIALLKSVATGGVPTTIANYKVSQPVTVTGITQLPEIYALTLSCTMQRTAFVDPAFIDVAGVSSATTMVLPLSGDQDIIKKSDTLTKKTPTTLTFFADKFETAFLNQPTPGIVLKAATGTNNSQANSDAAMQPPVWIVRFDTSGTSGIKVSFANQPAFYFAPIPLANSLQSFDAPINAYQQGQPYPAGTAVTKKFSSIDMDAWGRQFLQAIDTVLGPAYAVPAFLLTASKIFDGDPDYLQEIRDTKQMLAEAIEGTIDFIIDPCAGQKTPPCTAKAPANIGNAQEKWKQQLLNQLSNAYRYVAAVQVTADISSAYTGPNNDPPQTPFVPWLYGNMAGADPSVPGSNAQPKSTEYALSTAKVPIGNGKSWLTYLFEAKDAAEQRSFSFADMKYKVSHLEFDIASVPDMDDYLASSWLTFIIPLEGKIDHQPSPLLSMGDVGKTEIPVPLRAYPTPPSVSAQNFDYAFTGQTQGPATIDEVRKWNYTYTYQNPSAAQDTVTTKVEFNVTPDQQGFLRSTLNSKQDFYASLAQFISAYPSISADFDKSLSQLTPATITKTAPAAINARYALLAFISIIKAVAQAWKTTNQVNPRNKLLKAVADPVPPPMPDSISFTITESENSSNGNLILTALSDNPGFDPQNLTIDITGYTPSPVQGKTLSWEYYHTDDPTKFLSYEDRNKVPVRVVTIKALDVLNTQNAWSSVAVIRNEELLQNGDGSWQTTTPYFIYQTPLVRFYDKLIPLLNSDTAIDIATIPDKNGTTAKRSLADNLQALCNALTENIKSAESGYTIKMECTYQYTIPGTNFQVEVPVALLTPTQILIQDNGKNIADLMTKGITDWLNNNPEKNKGAYQFKLTAYSVTDAYIPILQVPLYLSLDAIANT